MGNKALRG